MKLLKTAAALLCLLGIGDAVHFLPSEHSRVAAALRQIPSDEKWFLDYFFRKLILVDGGAYVLYGSKPAVLGDFFSPTLEKLPFYGNRFFKNQVLMKKGFAVWAKYQHLFPSMNYHILFCEHKEEPLCCLVLVNKRNFLKVVTDNIDDFKAVLGREATPSSVYSQLIEGMSSGRSFLEVLNDHSGLLGILLGYGRHNSLLFYQRALLMDRMDNGIIDS